MQKSDVYPKIDLVRQHKVNAIKDKYSKTINALHEWKVSPCRGKEENRNLAVKRIMDCIFSDNESLDLSNLNLKSLPDISFLDFLIELDYQGNDGSFIESCFDLKTPHGQKLKNQSPLPSSVRSITINFGPLMLAGTERSGIITFEKPELPLPEECKFMKDYYSSYQFFYAN
ncbi:hypothetical protein JZM24_08150 [Candidatus Sodalis endolongispinus]|uniref:Uncharacterized protein n=1 Tax=Candidatus Sodalis endolongispinus TaxID=2812662 RepID=A0ABS5YAU6_9GAMM|nr:hypothetical protein [Candidatus Sodalis endolongispinus]MBT9432102.1 hypothetical protein [Candidatus Sodalis endolongispinus]